MAIVLPSSVVSRGACLMKSTVGEPTGETTANFGSRSELLPVASVLQLSSQSICRADSGAMDIAKAHIRSGINFLVVVLSVSTIKDVARGSKLNRKG